MERYNIVIVDEDYEQLRPLEAMVIQEFARRADVQIITREDFREAYFAVIRKIDLLVIDQKYYGEYLDRHEIANLLVLVSEVELGFTYPNSVHTMVKYLPAKEILATMIELLTPLPDEEQLRREMKPRTETGVISVYSPIGGCGKSLTAWGIAKKLKKLDQKVLLIGCDEMQSFACFLDREQYADDDLLQQMKAPGDEAVWTILQNVEMTQDVPPVSYLLPFARPLLSCGIGTTELAWLVKTLKEKQEYDFLVLDLGSQLNEQSLRLMELTDLLILVTEANQLSVRKMQKLMRNSDLLPSRKCLLVANHFHADGMRIASRNVFGALAPYETAELALEDPLFYRIALEMLR